MPKIKWMIFWISFKIPYKKHSRNCVVGDHFEPDIRIRFLGMDLDFPVLPASTAGAQKYNDALGVRMHLEHIQKTLKKAMFMTGTKDLSMADSRILF